MSDSSEQWIVDECDKYMESGLNKGICLDGSRSSLDGALGDFESALAFMPKSAAILDCCAMLKFFLEKKSDAREYHMRASRNKHCYQSETTVQVCRFVWVEFMKWTILGQPLTGEQIVVKYEEMLPALPPHLQSADSLRQVFKGDFHFSMTIERIGDNVELTLTLEHAEIGVSNFMEKKNFQGYFLHAYDIDVSPCSNWLAKSQLSTVKPVMGQTPQPIQQQETAGYIAQVAIGGTTAIPNFTVGYNSSQALSSFKFSEVMTASKGTPGNDMAMRSSWKVNTYDKGKPFEVEAVRKIRKLPYQPSNHLCNGSIKFQGKWVVPLVIAGGLQYEFHWMIHLNAKFALLPKKPIIPTGSAPKALTYEYAPPGRMEMSDFYSTSMARIFH